MGRGGALAQALLSGAVGRGSRIDDHAPSIERQLEGKRVGVGMAGQIVGSDRPHIENGDGIRATHPHVAALGEDHRAVCRPRRRRKAQPRRVGGDLSRRRGDALGGVVEEGDLTIRMGHVRQPAPHPLRRRAPRFHCRIREDSRTGRCQIDQVEQVLEDERVVHRAPLEVAAVGENLLRDLAPQDRKPHAQPSVGFVARKKRAGEHQRLGIGEQVIAEKMPFQPCAQKPGLDGQAAERGRTERLARQRPLAPVHDAQRQRIRLPAAPRAGRVLGDPAIDEIPVPAGAGFRAARVEIVEIMKVVAPEPVAFGPVPVGGPVEPAGCVEEHHFVRTAHRRMLRRRRLPDACAGAQVRRRPRVRPRHVEAVPCAPVDLDRAKMADRVPEAQRFPDRRERRRVRGGTFPRRRTSRARRVRHACSFASARVVRVTSTISSNGIGAGPPVFTARTKAAAQARCPLS